MSKKIALYVTDDAFDRAYDESDDETRLLLDYCSQRRKLGRQHVVEILFSVSDHDVLPIEIDDLDENLENEGVWFSVLREFIEDFIEGTTMEELPKVLERLEKKFNVFCGRLPLKHHVIHEVKF